MTDALAAADRDSAGRIPLTGGEVPTRFRIWRAGANPGDYGDCNVTPRALAAILAEQKARGTAIAIDIQHATNAKVNPAYDPANPPPIAGHAMLASENGDLWADPVRWTDCGRPFAAPGAVCCGKHQIETGQRPYVSPDWRLDKRTKEPVSLVRLSLVAEPGTYHVSMLAAADRGRNPMNDLDCLKALLAAAMSCAGSQDPDISAMGATVAGQVSDLGAAKNLDLSGAGDPAPPSQPIPAAGAAGCDPKVAARPPAPASVAAPSVTLSDVESVVASALSKQSASMRSIVAEDAERRDLIERNKATLGAMAPILAGKPLAEVKSFVAAATANASKTSPGTEPAPRGAPVPSGTLTTLSAEDRATVTSVARRMGVDPAKVEASIAKGENGSRGVSLVGLYAKKTEANRAGPRRPMVTQ